MGLLSWFMRVPKAGSHASLEDPVPCGKSNRSLEFLQESVRHTRFHPASEPLRQIISSEVRHIISKATHRRELMRVPSQLKSVSYEVDFAHGRDPKEVSELIGNIQQMARSLPDEVQDHYSETLRALSRMLGENGENNSEF